VSEVGRRCGFVAILGAPNAGKSTLVNRLVGSKISIVSSKVQTTRSRVLGIVAVHDAQVILIDTPGIFEPRQRLERAMVRAAWGGAGDADLVALVVDARAGVTDEVAAIVDRLRLSSRRAILLLNKIDLVRREILLGLAAQLNDRGRFDETFMISAANGDGTLDFLNSCAAQLPLDAWHFPEDQLSDMPERILATEITREQLFIRLHQELPYAVLVECDRWEERADGSCRIDQTITVRRDTQKAIVLGKGGAQIKAIGAAARLELQKLLDRPVHLFLFVKVREDWPDDRQRYAELGLDFDA
jgi:GTP-binding protein Era